MTTRFLIAASLLALAACGSKGDGNSTSSGGGLLGGAVQLQPGEWEMTMQVVDYKAPGMPAATAAQMKAAPPTTTKDCMTEEEAKGPKPDAFSPNQNGLNCKQENFSWANGRISGKTSCEGPNNSGKMSMTMDGNYTPTTMTINIKNETMTAANVGASIEMRVSGRRIGECPAGKAG